MSEQYFSIDKILALSTLPPQSRVHVIGVSGVAMAQIALALSRKGFRVSGSDAEFYEPMGGLLRASSIELCQGYRAENVSKDIALVVIGNAVGREHVEVVQAQTLQIPYTIFPALLADLCIGDRYSIVVSGTHGKTTTSAMGAFALESMGLSPSFFVGGEVYDLERGLQCGEGKWSIVEGDEYDSAFFAKVPKFNFYRPHAVQLTSIEFDHADIYPDIAAIDAAFDTLIAQLGTSGLLVACIEDDGVRRLLERWRGRGPRVCTYGTSELADVRVIEKESHAGHQRIAVALANEKVLEIELKLPGLHNALNAAGLLGIMWQSGLDVERAVEALGKFRGVKRRQQVRFDAAVTLIEDFAHHPTAVQQTIAAIRSWYPNRRLWAVFEPRSNTSRRKVFQTDYERAFDQADRVLLCGVTARERDARDDLMDTQQLSEAINARGKPCEALATAQLLGEKLQKEVLAGDVVLVMSNGGFGGLPALLEQDFILRFG